MGLKKSYYVRKIKLTILEMERKIEFMYSKSLNFNSNLGLVEKALKRKEERKRRIKEKREDCKGRERNPA